MGMTRATKETEVAQLNERFEDSEIVLLTHNKGLDAKSITELRLKMRENDVQFKVVKNTLAKIAVKGTRYEQIADMFVGPVGMATAKDPVSAAKAANDFSKQNDKFVVLGGAYGDMILDEAGIKKLASMPSLEELRATIAAMIMAPARNVAGAIKAPGGKVAGAVKAVAEKAE